MKKVANIPANIMSEIDFMLGSIELCNSEPMISVLTSHGIDPDGGWIDIDDIPKKVIIDIYQRLFKTGIVKPFFT